MPSGSAGPSLPINAGGSDGSTSDGRRGSLCSGSAGLSARIGPVISAGSGGGVCNGASGSADSSGSDGRRRSTSSGSAGPSVWIGGGEFGGSGSGGGRRSTSSGPTDLSPWTGSAESAGSGSGGGRSVMSAGSLGPSAWAGCSGSSASSQRNGDGDGPWSSGASSAGGLRRRSLSRSKNRRMNPITTPYVNGHIVVPAGLMIVPVDVPL